MPEIRPLAVVLAALALASPVLSPPALASADLVRSKNCVACHHPERRMIGPPFNAIAGRYASDPAALGALTRRVMEGGVGNWGQMPMPPQAGVSPAEAEALVRWILTHQ